MDLRSSAASSRACVPGAVVEVVEVAEGAAPYVFTCEERHMNPKSRVTGTIRDARRRTTLTAHAI
ncbi:hypothetical protein ACFWWM_08010 [Streptomyces sp. NPDC058682]|uniref:hypothetical protein n=1 Tax=unclassified Streptomyces TaxID=2593676 RepID=UPI0035E050A6